ncbi:MAG: DUF819 family protein [Bacteroidales bacterium]|nr:DUF819 family protein [Bacteroidales bacterium]
MISIIIYALIFIIMPALVVKLCTKVSFFGKIGPILLLYIIGVLIGQIPGLNNEATMSFKDTVTTVMIPLALPMMLFGCQFNFKDMKGIGKSLIAGLVAVVVATTLGYLLFGSRIADGPKVAGLLVGCETGGTINMAALKQALDFPSERYVLLNSYDMLICFLYFVFLLSVGIKWFRKVLPHTSVKVQEGTAGQSDSAVLEKHGYNGLWTRSGIVQLAKIMLAVICCLVLSVLVVAIVGVVTGLIKGDAISLKTVTGSFGAGWFMPVFILSLTTLAIVASFLKPVRKLTHSYNAGLYLIYIFSLAVASMADVTKLSFGQELYTLLFLVCIIFGSLLIQLLMSKLLKIEADMMIVTSVSLINSPPFVPMMVSAMKNPKVLVPGITVGIIGFAVGNYLGILAERLFALL